MYKKIACLVLALCFLLTTLAACTASTAPTVQPSSGQQTAAASSAEATSAQPEDGPLSPYAQPITLNIGKWVINNDKTLVDGDTVEDNVFTRYYEKMLNVKFVYAFQAESGDAFNQKAKLAIASGDIPDAMSVQYNEYKMAVQAGLVEDMTALYDQYASPLVKEIFGTADNKALESAKMDGKLMGIPSQQATGDFPNVLWVRKDWLDKLGLQVPQTLEEAAKVAEAFIKQDTTGKTVGFIKASDFTSIYTAFNSYPLMWIEKDGKAVYGSVTPETKDALTLLSNWYKDGLIDKEFVTRQNPGELVASGKCGIFFAPWWYSWSAAADAYKNDPKCVWVTSLCALTSDGKYNYRIPGVTNQYMIVKKGIEHPEAVIKCINLNCEEVANPKYAIDLKGENEVYWPLRHMVVRANEIEQFSREMRDALDGKMSQADIESKNTWWQSCYEAAKKEKDSPRSDLANWANGHAYVVGAVPLADGKNINKVYGIFNGVTDTMQSPKWDYLKKLEDETFNKIIMGLEPVSQFDSFVTDWNKNGGQTVTDEVNKLLGK